MTIKIEKGVEIPPQTRRLKYPFEDMEVGDSFFVKADPKTIRAAAHNYRKTRDKSRKFTIRAVDGGARVWRTK